MRILTLILYVLAVNACTAVSLALIYFAIRKGREE
jgi:hypothetical protein